MILRLLVLIFAFNAFIPSALAMEVKGNCMEMTDTGSTMIMSNSDSGMTCDMPEMDKSCSEILCDSGCSSSTSTYLFFDINLIYPPTDIVQPNSDLSYFYKIYPVINTPPPLV